MTAPIVVFRCDRRLLTLTTGGCARLWLSEGIASVVR